MKLALSLLLSLNFCFAALSIENKRFELIDEQTTCVDEYLKREEQLKRWLIFAPPATVVGGPVVFATSAAAVGFAGKAFGAGGWGLLGGMIGTGMILGGATVITGVVSEFVTASKFVNNRLILKSIIESRDENSELINTKKLLKKINKKLSIGMTPDVFSSEIRYLDESNKLCDGSLTKTSKTKKLKHLVASKKDLIRFFQ